MVGDDAISDFLSYLNLQKRYSPLTIQSYALDLRQFFSFLEQAGERFSLSEISHHQTRSFIADLIDRGNSPRSVNRKVSALNSFFKYLIKQELLLQNPMLRVTKLKTAKTLPVFVEEPQMEHIFAGLEFEEGFKGHRDKLTIDILYQTGLRRAELLGLKESDLDLFNLQLKVLGKRNKERVIPFDVALKRNIESYLQVKKEEGLSSQYLLVTEKNTPLSPLQLAAIVKKVLSKVTTSRKKSPHVLRHTFATHILNNGADINAVKELLGHASLAATQIYTHTTIDKLKKMYNQAHPRSGN